mgnify:CR=1 FL=1
MSCAHTTYMNYTDRLTGLSRRVEVPCGKCPSCMQSFQKQWAFRIKQTANSCREFIYDTLTIDDAKFGDVLDYSEIKECGDISIGGEWFEDNLPRSFAPSPESLRILEHYDFRVPYIARSTIARWIKLGKDSYNKHHKKAIKEGRMQRLNLRYVIVQEYGPLWNRSHYHCMFFGISYADYVRFFAKRWRSCYGFTKTKCIRSVNGRASASRISGYLTKYFSKQESCPLVRDGFLPKPFRLISHGIGAEYLKSDRLSNFGRFFGIDPDVWQACCSTIYRPGQEVDLFSKSAPLVQYLSSVFESYLRDTDFHRYSPFIFQRLLDALQVAYDDGYPLALPRYYRYKLLDESRKKLEKSVAYVVCAHYLAEFNSLREQAEIEKLYLAFNPSGDLAKFRTSQKLRAFYSDKYFSHKRGQAKHKEEQLRKMNHNFFVRPFGGNGVQSNLSFYEL